jgi:uncharacterized protein (DUF1330 family)
MNIAINPDPKKFQDLLTTIPKKTELVMLNLLKYRSRASYPDQQSELSGQQAYAIYAKSAFKFVSQVGGKPIWMGSAQASIIAPEGEDWDKIILVKYPSIEAFISMITNPDYKNITQHRTAALANSRLIAMIEDP